MFSSPHGFSGCQRSFSVLGFALGLTVTLVPTVMAALLAVLLAVPSLAQQSPSSRPSPRPSPVIPRSQRPNVTKAGGSLSAGCQASDKTLLALVPTANPVTTTQPYASVWVYIPYKPEDIRSAEFAINTGLDEKRRLYRSAIALPQTPGFVRLSVPAQPQYTLQLGTPYRWYFTLRCGNTTLSVDAGIERVAGLNPQPGSPWYDDLNTAAQGVLSNPQDNRGRDRWRQLLRELGLESLSDQVLLR